MSESIGNSGLSIDQNNLYFLIFDIIKQPYWLLYQIFPFEASRKYPEHNIYKFDLECTSKEMYKNALQSLSTLSKCVRSSPSSQTPHTPKETTPSASKAFFQTPGTLGSAVSAVPATRKRGSAQRRLDVGHPPTS